MLVQMAHVSAPGSGSRLVILNFAKGTHSGAEQRDAGSPVHCALERFQTIDLAFGLAVAPWLDDGVADRLYIDHQCPCEIHDRWNSTTLGLGEPQPKLLFITISQKALKANGQAAHHRKARDFMLQDRQPSDLALAQQRSRLHADRGGCGWGNARAGCRIKRQRSDRPFGRRGRSVGSSKASDMSDIAGQVSERALVAELLRLVEQPPDLRHTFAHQFLQRRMKSHWRCRFRVALKPLRKRFEPNPFVNLPPIDLEMSRDIRHRPALAIEFMHPGKQPLKALPPVSAIEVRPICPVQPLLRRANWPMPPTAQMPLDPLSQVLHQVKAVGDLPRLWSALTRCLGVETITITSDQLDAGSLGQPRRGADRRAIGQNVDHRPTLEVDRDSPVAKALP